MSAAYEKIIKFIDENIKNELTITEIADIAGYSANHIYKLFKAYSPYPVMEFIRRRKLYYAANEFYTGRKLCDIALDYGFETPAGFYKAFKRVFGCSPRTYKNNLMKEGIDLKIDNVKSIEQLDSVFAFAKGLYPGLQFDLYGEGANDGGKYGRNFWIEQWEKNPGLLLYAEDKGEICGVCLGWIDGPGWVTICGDGAAEGYKHRGVHEALFVEIEKRAKKIGCKGIVNGIADGEEEFYAGIGYIGKTLIQSEKYTIDDLKSFNEQYKSYEVTGSGVYDGYINQLWVNSSLLDKGLKKKFEEEIGDCWVQVIVSKEL
jgi:AraC-like DNA-binding protein